MKTFFLFFLTLFYVSSYGQDKTTELKKISSLKKAEDFLKNNSESEIISINEECDSSEVVKKIFNLKKDEIVLIEGYLYKIIEWKNILHHRASYIYFDGNKTSKNNIDSLREVIASSYKDGVSFIDLVKKYNMDKNPNNGDLGWFPDGKMLKEVDFEINRHEKGEVFNVDISDKKWYYVMVKNFDDKKNEILTVIKVKK